MGQCPNCGTATSPDQRLCLVCGAELAVAARPGEEPSSAPRLPPPGSAATGRPEIRGGRRAQRPGVNAFLPFLIAVAATVLMQVLLETAVTPGTYFHRLFRPEGGWFMAIVPGITVFAFYWACADLFFKFRI